MRLGWQAFSTSLATTSYLSSSHSIWKWLSSWQGYNVVLSFYDILQFMLYYVYNSYFFLTICEQVLICLLCFQFVFKEAGMDWIIHLDTDELIHPAGAREYSMRQLLAEVPGNVDMVIFPNYVSGLVSFLYLLCMEYYGIFTTFKSKLLHFVFVQRLSVLSYPYK